MRILNRIFFAGICCVLAMFGVMLTGGAVPLSQYGQIQNVQNYSSNPFWSPNGVYNQRMPQPVYATGPDVETSDCETVVANLVSAQCAARNKCIGTQLSDIRPAVMLQLSQMPGHNYATACGGYIDGAYQSYVSQNANAGPTGFPAAFPVATMPSPQPVEVKFENPYIPKELPEWQRDMLDRKRELQELQSQNGVGSEKIVHADFPKTVSDISFVDRMKNAAAGYEPYKDAVAYVPINVEKKEEQLTRMAERTQKEKELAEKYRERDKVQMSRTECCAAYPQDKEYCESQKELANNTSQERDEAVQVISAALKGTQK